VPFALLGAVQNQSRDWTIDKLMVGITYDSDIDRARKLIKQIGLDLAKDPEFAPMILEPLQRVPAAAGADCAAAGVAHGPLEQRAAQKLPCHRQLGDERLARLDDLVPCHLDK
jgi:small-conductance mechanosensitive channel